VNALRSSFFEQGPNRYSVTVADFSNGPKADEGIVNQALAELGKRGEVRFRDLAITTWACRAAS
jgi:hypothetical protein